MSQPIPTRTLLVRHTEPANAEGRCYGRLDIELSARGRQHAEQLARQLANCELTAIYSSPSRRALDTAFALGKEHAIEPRIVDDLREINFGRLEGRRYDEIEATDPHVYSAWMTTPGQVRFPDGECFTDLSERSCRALDAIRLRHRGETVAVVTHGGVVRAALAKALCLPADAAFRIDQPYGCVSIIDWYDETAILRSLGEVGDFILAEGRGRLRGQRGQGNHLFTALRRNRVGRGR